MKHARSRLARAKRLAALLVLAVALLLSRNAGASPKTCDGPAECCPSQLADRLTSPALVRLGVVLVGLYNVNERSGTWDADFYLNESWVPTPGFAPVTEIVNEIARQSDQFDETYVRDGRCYRSRRIHSTLRSSYNLRTFPFDHQHLSLEFSDAEFAATDLRYDETPSCSDLDSEAKTELSNWKVEGSLAYSHRTRIFQEAGAAPQYDYATFLLPVRRHITYHITKFFLPLFVIVAVAFTVFWIHPEDLNSKVAIGVTCLLAAIAFQLAEAGALPEVAYLTLADRVYAICYTMLALALMFVIYGNSLVRRKRLPAALKLDRFGRYSFPIALFVAVVFAVLRSTAASIQ